MSLWNTWKEDLKELSNLRISRCFVSDLTNVNSVELHGFGDASPKASGAVVYVVLKDESGKVNVQLVMSKNRVAATKRVTLPRLELLAAFILSKLLKFVLESLKVTVDRIVCWSDSFSTQLDTKAKQKLETVRCESSAVDTRKRITRMLAILPRK